MKIQINDAGSWRHVLTFDRTVERDVRQRAIKLVAVVNERSKLRILDDQGNLRATCKGPEFTWEEKAQ
jgi:hypothetical protein